MGADLSVFAVDAAGALGLDGPAGLEEERDGHFPSAGLVDLAADFEGLVIVGDAEDFTSVADRQTLIEDLGSAPRDELLLCYPALRH